MVGGGGRGISPRPSIDKLSVLAACYKVCVACLQVGVQRGGSGTGTERGSLAGSGTGETVLWSHRVRSAAGDVSTVI